MKKQKNKRVKTTLNNKLTQKCVTVHLWYQGNVQEMKIFDYLNFFYFDKSEQTS